MSFPKRIAAFCLLALSTVALAENAFAQYNHPPEPAAKPGSPTLNGDLVKTGLYVFSGAGGNCLLRLSGNGSILVNTILPSEEDILLRKVKRISDQPIRALVLTDGDPSRASAAEKFAQMGTRIFVHQRAADRLKAANNGELVAIHLVTYDRDYSLQLGGIEVQLLHFGNAHSNGDTVVYFPNLKVVAVGALMGPDANADFSSGGSVLGWRAALEQILKLDFDVVIPSTGPAVTRADLEAFKTKMDSLVSRATTLLSKGVAKDQLMAQLNTDDLDLHFSFAGNQLDRFYAELSGTK